MVRPAPDGDQSGQRTPCPVCGATSWRHLFAAAQALPPGRTGVAPGLTLVECSRCGTCALQPTPTAEEILAAYGEGYEDFAPGGLGWRWLRRRAWETWVRRLATLTPEGRVLEIGCGRGELLAVLERTGRWEVLGLEPSPYAVRVAQAQGLKVEVGSVEEAERLGGIDAIILHHVIEHLPDPAGALQRLQRALNPGGWLLLTTPNVASWERRVFGRHWHGWQVPYHLFLFGPSGLQLLLRRAGFGHVRIRHSFVPNSWAGSLRLLLGARGFPRPLIALWDTRNPAAIALAAPLATAAAAFHAAGRLDAVARGGSGTARGGGYGQRLARRRGTLAPRGPAGDQSTSRTC